MVPLTAETLQTVRAQAVLAGNCMLSTHTKHAQEQAQENALPALQHCSAARFQAQHGFACHANAELAHVAAVQQQRDADNAAAVKVPASVLPVLCDPGCLPHYDQL
jgi:hypothetical protein